MGNFKYSFESLIMRSVQVSLFMISQSSSRMITSTHRWESPSDRWWSIIWIIVMVLLWLALHFGLAEVYARFIGLCSLGEFVDDFDLDAILELLEEHHYEEREEAHRKETAEASAMPSKSV